MLNAGAYVVMTRRETKAPMRAERRMAAAPKDPENQFKPNVHSDPPSEGAAAAARVRGGAERGGGEAMMEESGGGKGMGGGRGGGGRGLGG